MKNKKTHKNEINAVAVWLVCCFFILFFLAVALQGIWVCRNIDSGNLKEFSGEYELSKLRIGRQIHSHFTLKNGDTLCLANGLNAAELPNNSPLHFRYCQPYTCIRLPAYTCAEITNMEGNVVLLSLDASRREAMGLFYLGAGFAAVLALAAILCAYCFHVPKRRKHK